MKFHEYQTKELLKERGFSVPGGVVCHRHEEITEAVHALNKEELVIKAQVHAGGRGKAGGVVLAHSKDEARQVAEALLGRCIVTEQTGANGVVVKKLLIEQQVAIQHEYYLGFVIDRAHQCVTMIASSQGGMDIESVARYSPEAVYRVPIDVQTGLTDAQAQAVAEKLGLKQDLGNEFVAVARSLYLLMMEHDGEMLEINPLVVTQDQRVMILDAKFSIDDNAVFRQQRLAAIYDNSEDDPDEVEAKQHDLAYVTLDGSIGCMVNGAGLAMATLDIIEIKGGKAANFLDVGGNATEERVVQALTIILKNPKVRAVLINIFGGIVRCDLIAKALVNACKTINLSLPVIVRLEGSMNEEGRQVLKESGLKLIPATSMEEAAALAVDYTRS